ncbi:MAG: DJ-1 family glyoxalase III [Candidatus Neomarinimicrobiota bacterium]
MMPRVIVPLADGFEEIEAITIIDILRRAEVDVLVAGVGKEMVEGSHGITVRADTLLSRVNLEEFDMIALPGGLPGMENLRRSKQVIEAVQNLKDANKFTAAICASPVVLEEAGVVDGRAVTSHPNQAKFMVKAHHTGKRVEVDEKVITGQAAGSAMEFAFKLVEILVGREKVEQVNRGVIARTA